MENNIIDMKETTSDRSDGKITAWKRAKDLTKGSKWSLLQQITQEILATYIVEGTKRPTLEKLTELMTKEVEARYKEELDTKKILMEALPSRQALARWLKQEGWDQAVWEKIRVEGVFTAERRTKVINALYNKAVDKGDVNAAKMYLIMSGDYQEKLEVKQDPTMDKYREINSILQAKKNE